MGKKNFPGIEVPGKLINPPKQIKPHFSGRSSNGSIKAYNKIALTVSRYMVGGSLAQWS
jgi:hypothetical protein